MQVSHDATRSNYIINLSLTRDPSFSMELLDVNASFLSVSSMLYVHCLDFVSQSHIVASNLACCKFLTVLGHVSFPKSLRERRLCLFVESDKLKDLGNKASPAVINVKSSCIHKVSKLFFAQLHFSFLVKVLSVKVVNPSRSLDRRNYTFYVTDFRKFSHVFETRF